MSDVDAAQSTPENGRHRFLGPMCLCVLGMALYLPCIRWGLPATTSWSQDTIAGVRTLGGLQGWPDNWQGRYAPFHYLTLGLVYQPVLWQWERAGQYRVDAATGRIHFAPPHAAKIGTLILLARVVSVLMAVGTVLLLWAATRRLTGDDLVALLAGLTLMLGAAFTYFAHLGNVDVPALFWFSLSFYFFVRLLESSTWRNAVLLGLTGSLAVTTKESLAGVYPGMALVLVVVEMIRLRDDCGPVRGVRRAVLQPKWLVAMGAFIIPHLYLCGVFTNPDAYIARLRYWLAPAEGTLHARQVRYPDQLQLIGATIRYAAGGIGWPLVVAMAAAVVHTLIRHARIALLLLVPALSFYVIIIAQIEFVYSRFLFAPIALLCPVVGLSAASLLRRSAWPLGLRLVALGAFLLPTAGYALAMDLAMLNDSRYEAEAWFREHVEPAATVGAFSDAQYLPRLAELGYATYQVRMVRRSFDQPQPDYLVLTNYNYEDFDEEQKDCLRSLLAGELGYEPVIAFAGRYLGTGSNPLSLAGWGAPTPGKISPTITILRRDPTHGCAMDGPRLLVAAALRERPVKRPANR